jgi:S-adenosylmethionine-diacylgycerolhomoserine-N-methlytransferase
MSAAAPHAARMDAVYATQRHFYDLTRKYYLLGRDALVRDIAPPAGGTVLEIGCGTARNLIAVARRWPRGQFFGLDISTAMLATARGQAKRAGLAITLGAGDAAAFDPQALFGRPAFDRVFLSYTLSMIPDWQGALRQAAAVVAAGGELHVVDFGQQERLPGWWRRLLFAWLAKFGVTPRRELPAALKRLAADTGMTLAFDPLYRGYAWGAVLSRPPAPPAPPAAR